jgi:signal transduction histidine kinase
LETLLRKRNGAELPVLFSASWLADEEGKQPGLVCVAQDITEWKETQEKLRDLTDRLINAQEEERRRLGRELHDDLTQRLAAISIDAGMLRRELADGDRKSAALVERIRQEMAALSRDIHDLSHRLHPSVLEDLGLADAIESESRVFFERGGPPVEISCTGVFDDIAAGNQLGLYRIVQEALRNIRRHSGADEVRISLCREDGRVLLSVEDNGCGFDPKAREARGGIGLASIEERVRLMQYCWLTITG